MAIIKPIKPCDQRTFCCSDVFNAMQKKESGNVASNGIGVIGDQHLDRNNPMVWAYGPFQIRYGYWKDAIRAGGVVLAATFPEGVLTSRGVSELIVCEYMRKWASSEPPTSGASTRPWTNHADGGPFERLRECRGTMKDVEIVARIHNGGPWGFNRTATQAYWDGGNDRYPDFKMWLCEVTKHK